MPRLTDIRLHLRGAIGSTRDPELAEDILTTVMEAMPEILRLEREAVTEEIAKRLESLGEGRLEYVHNRDPKSGDEIEAMGGMQGTIYGEATGAQRLARIIRGEIDDKGWLPSWRWT
jgi:hypothetical protein